MSKLVLVCLAVMVGVALPQDDYDHYFGGPRPSPSPSIPNEGNQDTGPVLFPNSPVGGETSGVIVGASGYGFVPPRNQIGGVPHYGSISSVPSYGSFF